MPCSSPRTSGTVERATQAAERGIEALRLPARVFITHLHSDHVRDYPELLWTLWWRRPTPIVAYGPRGLRALTESQVFSERGLAQRTDEWQRYHRAAHTSPTQVAEVATRAAPGLLVLYHQLYFGATDDELIGEVRAAGYDGPLVSGRDLDVF